MAISFNLIPASIRTPGQYIEVDNSRAVQGTPAQPHVALVIGQRLSTGTVAEAVPALVGSGDAADGYWGVGSMMAEMCRAFKVANPYTELWGCALDDGGAATAGTQTLTFTGAATADGSVVLYIGGVRFSAAISDTDDATAVATAVTSAITGSVNYARLPMTAASALGVVTLTARNLGTLGNDIDVRVNYNQGEQLPAGVSVAIAAGVTGATDPVLQTAITGLGDVQYHTIAQPYTDATNLTVLEAELLTRWGPMEQKEGHAFSAALGTQGTLTTLGNGRNSQFSTILEVGGSGGNSPTPTYIAAAVVAAVDALQTTVDPARPRQTINLPGVLPPESTHRFTREERDVLLTDGIATHFVDGGGLVRIERLITTYQTNPLSTPDPSYLDITTLRTISYIRYAFRTLISLKYPRHKLAADTTLFSPGQAIVTPSVIRAELISLFRAWEFSGLVENFDQFKEDLIVERSTSDVNRVDVRMSPDLINQFRVLAGQIQFLL